jgi:hypothetical protein
VSRFLDQKREKKRKKARREFICLRCKKRF